MTVEEERDLLFIAFAFERWAEHSDTYWNRCNTPEGYFALYTNGREDSMFCYLLADKWLSYIGDIPERSHEQFGLQRKLEYKETTTKERIKMLQDWTLDND